jgi:dolichyl-phosphate-mannose--protein O-mannosyl transferase
MLMTAFDLHAAKAMIFLRVLSQQLQVMKHDIVAAVVTMGHALQLAVSSSIVVAFAVAVVVVVVADVLYQTILDDSLNDAMSMHSLHFVMLAIYVVVVFVHVFAN